MKKLKIAQIAPLWYKIPPEKYGGIELIVHSLTEGLVERGHKVTLFASGDSKTSAKLVSVYPRHLRKDNIKWTDQEYTLLNLSEVFKRQDEFDVIHSHVDLYDLYFTPFIKKPFISTMHNRLMIDKIKIGKQIKYKQKQKMRIDIYRHFHNHGIVTISNAQKKLSQAKMNFIGTVYNGVDIKKLTYNSEGSDYFIWIGRMHKDKGVENAIKAAKKLGMKLLLAGRVKHGAEKEYFEEKIKPHIDGKKIKFIGEITVKQKSEFFGKAKALLCPIEWDEPFGLVMTEAMACGTPVIAYDRGSVSEIVKEGKTGYVVKSINGMIKAMKEIDKIDRRECRRLVEEKFSIDGMVDNYEKIYYKLANKK